MARSSYLRTIALLAIHSVILGIGSLAASAESARANAEAIAANPEHFDPLTDVRISPNLVDLQC